jgi:hypothetical protein
MKYPETFKIINESFVRRMSDGAEISVELGLYQCWLAEGNTPEPADPLPEITPAAPTIIDLQAQLAALSAQIAALAGTK